MQKIKEENEKESLSRCFVRSRNTIVQSWINRSHYCCCLTHPRTAGCLRVIWSHGQSQLNPHCNTLKQKTGADGTLSSLVVFMDFSPRDQNVA